MGSTAYLMAVTMTSLALLSAVLALVSLGLERRAGLI